MKAIAYIRVSTTNQDVTRQSIKIKDFCSSNNYELVNEIIDFGVSGSTFDRAGYKQLQGITKEDANIVIISELSRLSRKEDILDTLNAVQSIIDKGLKLLFLDNQSKIYEDNLDIMEIVMLSVGAYGAAQERLQIKRRNQEGKVVLFANNPYAVVDGKIPFGFSKVANPAGSHPKYLLEINEDESEVIKKLYDLIIEGNSVASVMHYLYNTGIRHSDNIIFTKQHLSKLYNNEIYKGIRNRKGIKSYITPIVSAEIWDLVQLKIKDNYKYGSTGTTMFNPLRGIIKCRCGRAMMIKSKGDGVYIYRCSDVQPAYMPNKCTHIDSIRFDLTNEVVFSLLKSIDFVEVKSKFADKITDLTTQFEGINKQIEGHNKQISTIKEEIEVLNERYFAAKTQSLADSAQERTIVKEAEVIDVNKTISKKIKQVSTLKEQIKNLSEVSKDEDFSNLDIKERSVLFRRYIKEINFIPVTRMQGFYKIQYISGVESLIAVKKTGNSPIFATLPDAFTLTEDLKIKVLRYNKAESKELYDFSAVRNETITLTEFFKNYAGDYLLDVDLSYRNN